MKKWMFLLMINLLLIGANDSWAEDFEGIPKLVVKGEASIFKPADQMEITLGVVTTARQSSEALNENNQKIHQVVDNLQAIGLQSSEYQTGRFHIHPIYRSNKSGEVDRTVISHYEVVNSIQIKTQKMELVPKIIEAASQGGANQVDQLNFNLNNPQAYREEAIKLAAQNALMDMHALVEATRVHPVRILYLSLDYWDQLPRSTVLANKASIESLESVERADIEAGKVEIHATVHMTFEIASER